MGQYSSWSICFRHANNTPIQDYVNKVNDFIQTSGEIKSNFDYFGISCNADFKEASTEWETTSFSAQDNAEDDLRVLSAAFPELIFHCVGDIDNGDPEFYINAQAGKLEWNWPEISYPGFESIFYDDSDKPQSCPYTVDDLRLAVSDMNKLTEMVKANAPAGTFDERTTTTEIAAWALREMLTKYYGEEE